MLSGGREKKLISSCQGRFRLEFRKKFSTYRVIQPWHSLPRAVVGSPSIWRDLKHVDVALGDIYYWWYCWGIVGFKDLERLLQP